MSKKYLHNDAEKKWLKYWENNKLFYSPSDDQIKEKLYLLFAFAYPSGSGLHVGHVESKTALDILARYNRMQGKNVFFPVGWDAFGLPAENYAIKTGTHPAITTKAAIDTFRRQIRRIGISYNWDHEIATNHPEYYRWTQWIFLQLYKKGLAYKAPGNVNWCESCQTVLANEQVVDGKCERCGTEVIQKLLDQWYFKISDYKDELISGLETVDWPEATISQQLNWIGKSSGHLVNFGINSINGFSGKSLSCFTTRVDTIFGATFIAISPEKAQEFIDSGWEAGNLVKTYITNSAKKTEEERKVGQKNKTGVRTNLLAINPVNNQEIPIYVADYVLAGYGTGAVMGVPGHDNRDWEFATTHQLPIVKVIHQPQLPIKSYLMGASEVSDNDLEKIGIEIVKIEDSGNRHLIIPEKSLVSYEELVSRKLSPGFWNEYLGSEVVFIFKHTDGRVERLVLHQDKSDQRISELCHQFTNGEVSNSKPIWEMLVENVWYQDISLITDDGVLINSGEFSGLSSQEARLKIAESNAQIGPTTTYKLRDWLISRQRYWGAPIPIVYDPQGKPHPVKDEHLPWRLPTDVDFNPHGESPLRTSKEFIERTEKLYGKGWRPEFDTMDTFVDSSWYYLRYADARNPNEFASKKLLDNYLPVDFYMIGPEHIVLHLLYSRFFTKFLRDQGLLDFSEPFMKMRHQGMILGPDHKKMSKSKGNVIDPDLIVDQYGADTLRMYEMFMGPIEADKPWNERSVVGIRRFLDRIYRLYAEHYIETDKVITELNITNSGLIQKYYQLVNKLTSDIPDLKFNTSIAAMMEFVNSWEAELKKPDSIPGTLLGRDQIEGFIKILAPFAPYLAEELWFLLSKRPVNDFESIHLQSWPKIDPQLLIQNDFTYVVQVNGKMRASFHTQIDVVNKDEIIQHSRGMSNVSKWILGKLERKVIFIPATSQRQGAINFVVS